MRFRTTKKVVGRLAGALWRVQRAKRLLVLTYHRVLPQNHSDRSREQPGMICSPEVLRIHVRALRQHFDIIHLEDSLRDSYSKRQSRIACALTFDDGWHDNYEYALPVLRAESAPATIFVVTGMVGAAGTFWPNRLQSLLVDSSAVEKLPPNPENKITLLSRSMLSDAGGQWGRSQLDHLVAALKAFPDTQVIRWIDMLAPTVQQICGRSVVNWQELEEMQKQDVFRVGSHTRSHARLAQLETQDEIEKEVALAQSDLQKNLGREAALFCYPNGEYSPLAREVVARHHLAAVTTDSGWNSKETDRYLIRRISVHDSACPDALLLQAKIATAGFI